jgi:hypothetical protein
VLLLLVLFLLLVLLVLLLLLVLCSWYSSCSPRLASSRLSLPYSVLLLLVLVKLCK